MRTLFNQRHLMWRPIQVCDSMYSCLTLCLSLCVWVWVSAICIVWHEKINNKKRNAISKNMLSTLLNFRCKCLCTVKKEPNKEEAKKTDLNFLLAMMIPSRLPKHLFFIVKFNNLYCTRATIKHHANECGDKVFSGMFHICTMLTLHVKAAQLNRHSLANTHAHTSACARTHMQRLT